MAETIERTDTPADIRVAVSGEVRIAYQVVGAGALDLLLLPGFYTHLEYAWHEPSYAEFLRRLATGARLIRFQHQVTTLALRGARLSVPERLLDGLRLALDGADSRRAVLFATGESVPLASGWRYQRIANQSTTYFTVYLSDGFTSRQQLSTFAIPSFTTN